MSRSKEDYETHILRGGMTYSDIQPEKCAAERQSRATRLLSEAGYTVTAPAVSENNN